MLIAILIIGDILYHKLKDKNIWYSETTNRSMVALWSYLGFLYLPLSVDLMSIFQCTKDPYDGLEYMTRFPSIVCDANIESRYSIASTLQGFGLFWVLLYPIVICSVLALFYFFNKKKHPLMIVLFSALYFPYKEDYFWYEGVAVLRKFVFALVVGLLVPQSTDISLGILVVLLGSMILNIYVKPYKSQLISHVETISFNCLVIIYFCGILFTSPIFGVSSKFLVVLFIISILFYIVFVIICSLSVALNLYRKNRSTITTIKPQELL